MSEILIDTERLQSLMGALDSACKSIEEAMGELQQMTTHENWACPERHAINDYILTNRADIQKLQVRSFTFTSVARQVANEFVETESGISGLFHSLEDKIGDVLSLGKVTGAGAALQVIDFEKMDL